MTRSKPPSFPTAFLSSLAPDDRKAMERAASILQIPVVDLVASPPRSDGGGLQSQQQSVGSRAIDLDHNDYRSGWFFIPIDDLIFIRRLTSHP
jgi:hypothetical protein